jgi:hypothetical protein
MRGLAFGVHDPGGERYRLAQLHYRGCPACRAYVLSLRGLAAVLPPLALPWLPGVAGLGGALGGGASSSAAGVGGGSSAAGLGGSSSAAGLSGAAGAGAAGGWLPLGGSFSIKLATGCLLFAGVGGGCVALIAGPGHSRSPAHNRNLVRGSRAPAAGAPTDIPSSPAGHFTRPRTSAHVVSASHPHSARASVASAGTAQRELGFERPARSSVSSSRAQASRTAKPRPRAAPGRGAASEFGAG